MSELCKGHNRCHINVKVTTSQYHLQDHILIYQIIFKISWLFHKYSHKGAMRKSDSWICDSQTIQSLPSKVFRWVGRVRSSTYLWEDALAVDAGKELSLFAVDILHVEAQSAYGWVGHVTRQTLELLQVTVRTTGELRAGHRYRFYTHWTRFNAMWARSSRVCAGPRLFRL